MIRRSWPRLGDRGAAAAEFAVALPAVVVVVALGAAVLGAGAGAVRLQQTTAEAARMLSRGDEAGRALALVASAGSAGEVERRDGLVCVSAIVPLPAGLPALPVRSCALDGGR